MITIGPEFRFTDFRQRVHRIFSRENRRIIAELIRANLKSIDHNSVIGIAWSLLGPLVMFIVLYFVFKDRVQINIRTYPLYLLSGIIFVNYFVTATSYITKIFTENRYFIINSNTPKENILISNLFVHTYKFLIEVIICLVLASYYRLSWFGNIVWIILAVFLFILLIIGIGFMLSVLYCFARDIDHIWALLSRLLFFATPVFYTTLSLSDFTRPIITYANPITPFLMTFRSLIIGDALPPIAEYALLISLMSFVVGYYAFLKFESLLVERT